jgi:signal transduction histidine kinase
MNSEEAQQPISKQNHIKALFGELKNTLRSLRWRLTFSYSLVTIGALLVMEIILMVGLMSYFISNIDLSPETIISNLRAEWTPKVQEFFSEEPPNISEFREYLNDVQGTSISTRPLVIFGNLELEMNAQDFLNFYYLLDDRTLVDAIPQDIVTEDMIGKEFPQEFLPGLEKHLSAALDGVKNEDLLYSKIDPGNRIVGAIPVFRYESGTADPVDKSIHQEPVLEAQRKVAGVIVFATKRFPWGFLPIGQVMLYIVRSLLIFTLFAGFLGSIFGMLTANNLTQRLKRVSQAAHDWSQGDFSVSIRDKTNDEIGKLADDLNKMAEQLENLLDRRMELTLLEERNRLARELHDSVKQQAFAASAQIAAAKSHFRHDPDLALQHFQEADDLICKVREELTDLIQELRPVEMKGKGLIPAVKEHVNGWQRRNKIETTIRVRGERSLPVDVEKCIFRVIQEALANVAWHSEAKNVKIFFKFNIDELVLTVMDDGKGFNLEEGRKEGLGLNSMCERTTLIGGTLEIQSDVNSGTRIILKYPYQKMEI